MAVYVILLVLVVALAIPVKNDYMEGTKGYAVTKVALFSVFILLFAVSACRIAVGNDYWPYVANFDLIRQSRDVASEIGFNLLVKAVQGLFHFTKYYVVVFAIVSFATCYCFVKGIYRLSEWFMYSLFLLLANGFYYSSLNSVRYYLALAIALVAIKFVLEERDMAFVVTVALGAFMHKSILVVIPVYILCRIKWKKLWHLVPVGFVVSLWVFQDIYRKIIFLFYEEYEGTDFDNNDISYINILKSAAVAVFAIIYYKDAIKDNKANRLYFNLNIAALVTYAICYYMPESTRIGYYFSITNILLIPGILKRIKNKRARITWTVMITLAYLLYFAFYLYSCYDTNIRILPYRNWIFN